MRRFAVLIWFLGLIYWPLYGSEVVRVADPRLEKVLADLQKRQNAVQSIEYRVEGEHKVPKGAYTRMCSVLAGPKKKSQNPDHRVAPAEDLRGAVGFTLLLDFAKERYRLESNKQNFNFSSRKLEPQSNIYKFDGKEMKCFMPRDKNLTMSATMPDIGIVSGNMKVETFLAEYLPIFFGQGRIYAPMEQIVPGQLRNKPDPNYLHIHGTGVQDDRACLILRTQTLQLSTTSFEEYWVDTTRENAIVRYMSYVGKKPTCNSDIVMQYRHVPDGWFLAGWHWTVYDSGKTLYVKEMRVTNMKINPVVTAADFAMEIRPGMIVEEVASHPTRAVFYCIA